MFILKALAATLIVALILVPILIRILGPEKFWAFSHGPADLGEIDFATLKKTARPNQFLVCPEGFCELENPDKISPVYKLTTDKLRQNLLASLEQEKRLQRVDDDSEPNKLRFVQRTAKMLFPDTIRIELVPVGKTKSTLAIYSQSQVGYSDRGFNKARVNRWLKRIAEFEV